MISISTHYIIKVIYLTSYQLKGRSIFEILLLFSSLLFSLSSLCLMNRIHKHYYLFDSCNIIIICTLFFSSPTYLSVKLLYITFLFLFSDFVSFSLNFHSKNFPTFVCLIKQHHCYFMSLLLLLLLQLLSIIVVRELVGFVF